MVATQGPKAGRQGRATAVRQLLGVQLDRQAQRLRGGKDAAGLGRAEADALAKRVHGVHQALGVQLRQHGQHRVHIAIATPGKFGRHGMRTQEGGADRHRQLASQGAGHLQHLALTLQRQTVTRFDFHRGHTLCHQGLQAHQALRLQCLGAGSPGIAHGRGNTAAAAGDLLIARAVQAQLKLARPVTRIHQVGVAIDQAGRDQGATAILLLQAARAQFSGQRLPLADPEHALAIQHQRSIVNQAIGPLRASLHGGHRTVGP